MQTSALPFTGTIAKMPRIARTSLVLSVAIACLCASDSSAQGWFQQFIAPQRPLYAVAALDASHAIAFDDYGRLYRLDGLSWDGPEPSGTDSPVYGLSFANSAIGTAVGGGGVILRTTDGGLSWMPQSSGTSEDLIAVSLVNESIGTSVGTTGTILRTTDGGDSWMPQTSGTMEWLFGVSFLGEADGVAVGDNGTILRTTDGGDSWVPQDSGTDLHLQTVSMVSTTTAIVVGDMGTILKTEDGGDHWDRQQINANSNLYGLSLVDANRGFAVGCFTQEGNCNSAGIALRTTDGGFTWSEEPILSGGDLFAVSLFDANSGIAVGDQGIIWRLVDGGWQRMCCGGTDQGIALLGSVSVTDANTGTAVGSQSAHGAIVHTTDGGNTWTQQFLYTGSGYTHVPFNVEAVSFVDANNGIAVGYDSILRTTDGGAHWVLQSGGGSGFVGVSLVDAKTAIAIGYNFISRTTDGGSTWRRQAVPLPRGGGLVSGSFRSADVGIVVGGAVEPDSGVALRTSDGGATWTGGRIGAGQLRGVSYGNPLVVCAVGNYLYPLNRGAYVLRSSDGGASWSEVIRLPNEYLSGVNLLDANIGTAVGGPIIRTTDGGATWMRQPHPGDSLYSVALADVNVATAVGGTTILRTETGGK